MKYSLPERAVLLVAALAGVVPAYAAALDIAGAWLRQPPPGQTSVAIYMELHNGGSAPLAVVGARVEGAASASVHGHRHADGMMRMYPVPRLEIAPGAELSLQPGGYHLMVGGMGSALQPGALLPFCLRLEDGVEQCAEARVRKIGE
jgi:copper(I)-binding protein